ncbi:MAG: UDP-N-acetylglucosamine 2-epimerase, partial [candidate division WOR-3 bacterium]
MAKEKSSKNLVLSSPLRCLFIFGTRPEAIKLAPVIKELAEDKRRFSVKICVTAQHRDMLDMVLETFHLHPDFDLGIMREGQTLFDINVRVLRGLEKLLQRERPDSVFVQGDT